jgi:subtilisin family serine protease
MRVSKCNIKKVPKGVKEICLAVLLAGVVFGLSASGDVARAQEMPPGKIVVFKEDFVNEAAQAALVRNCGAVVNKPLRVINGMAVALPPQAESALRRRAEVLRIDEDLVIEATGKLIKQGKMVPPPPQVMPWNIAIIGADLAWPITVGEVIDVAVVDTGIDLEHPDLAANIKGHFNAINTRKSGDDDNGHGTHVAGVIAALDDEIGVVGVGPRINLHAVKVLNRKGTGKLSDLIEGLQWCINNQMDVVNLSLGSLTGNQSFHDAISAAYCNGIVLVASAGNNGFSGGAIDYPAKYPETIAVSAVGQAYDGSLCFAGFSSWGSEVDLAAPGANIYSTCVNKRKSSYEVLDGTSMAAPHVAGTAALVLSIPVGGYDTDGNGSWSPDEVKAQLLATANDIGLFPEEQGAGLVDAESAVK